MRMSAGIEWAVHCCVVLAGSDGPVTAARLAELHDVSRTSLAKHLQALAGAGIVEATEGRSGGYVLTRPPSNVTLWDVVQAVEGRGSVFRCTEIRQRGPLAASAESCTRACAVARAMHDAEQAYRAALGGTTIADLVDQVEADSGPGALATVTAWLRRTDDPDASAGY